MVCLDTYSDYSSCILCEDFLKGEVYADGLRNEVALDFALDGTLWGVGNSADMLFRADLGGDIHNNNPAEEVHRFDRAGLNFGYPYCWREFDMLLGKGRGTAWAWPDPFGNVLSKSVSDEQCRTDYDKPVLALQGHSAPLGLTFYRYNATRPAQCNGVTPFPPEMNGFAFVAYHGSWNRPVPTGFKVVYFPLTKDGTGVEGGIGATPQDLLFHDGATDKWSDGFRPVDVSFDVCGRLLVTSDGSRSLAGNFEGDKIVRIEATKTSLPPSPVPAPQTIGNGLFIAFFAGIWTRIRTWLGLLG
jgi:glucose/arabinose dehydrogenase